MPRTATVRSDFEILARRKYDKMRERARTKLKKLGIPVVQGLELPFSLAEFVDWIIVHSHEYKATAFECLYCKRWLTIQEVEPEHMFPLSRGGSNDRENLAISCHKCNQQKNELTVEEFDLLKIFLRRLNPTAEKIVLQAMAGSGQGQRLRFARKK